MKLLRALMFRDKYVCIDGLLLNDVNRQRSQNKKVAGESHAGFEAFTSSSVFQIL